MMDDIFGRNDGYIHTAAVSIAWREGIDVEEKRSDRKRITKWVSGVNGTKRAATMRFNPNKETIVSPFSGNVVSKGNCRSLAEFEDILSNWACSAGYDRSDVDVTRVDFAMDCYDEREAALFRKLCDLMIVAFIVRHGIEDKHQYWGETTVSMRPKNNKAVWGQIAMERYNKALQQMSHGAIWRTELRYEKDLKHPEREQPESVREMLEALQEELRSLPAHYEEAQERVNEAMYARYCDLQDGSKDSLKVNQFLYMNSDRVFSRSQIVGFYNLIGAGDGKRCRKRADNYSARYAHLYITRKRFEAFIEWVIGQLEKYLTNEVLFTDENSPSEEEKPA